MPKVICTRPNASLNINGVNFTPTEDGGGVISDEISAEEAELFLSIDGYHAAEEGEQKPSVVKPAAAPKAPAPKPATAPAKPTTKKAAPAPAATSKPSDEKPADAPAGEGKNDAPSENKETGSNDAATGAGEGGGNDDPNVF